MNTYIYLVSITIPIFIILITIEAIIATKKGIKINNSADVISSLSSGISNTTRDGIKFGITLISYSWLVNNIAIIEFENRFLIAICAFITQDFAGYWIHRLNHRINILWNRHLIHHSSEEFNLSCALRQSISNNLKFNALFLIPAALIGIPTHIFILIAPIHLFMQFWYHTRLIDQMGLLEYILVTPSHHRVHHAINPEYIDKNYSQIFIIWDKLFGTFKAEDKSIPPVYGILRPTNTWNPIFINFKHLWQIIKDAYYTKKISDKICIWFMPTGWRPNDVKIKFPLNSIDNPYAYKKFSPKNSQLKIIWSWIQLFIAGLLMFIIFINFNKQPQYLIYLIAITLFLHIISYTLLLDNNKNAFIFELFKMITIILILSQFKPFTFDIIYFLLIVYVIFSFLITIYYSHFQKLKTLKL